MRQIALWVILLVKLAFAEPMSLLNGKLSLELPNGFVQLTPDDISRKWPRQRPPEIAFANDRKHMTVSIAVRNSPTPVEPGQLEKFGETMARVLTTQGKVETKGLLEISGRKWYRLVLTSQGVDQPIRNEMLFTPEGSGVLMLNLNSTTKEYPKYQKSLERARQSLLLSPPR